MSLVTKILAIVNILAALVVIYLAKQVVAARIAWVRALDSAAKARDGEIEIFNEVLAKDEVLKKLDPEKKKAISDMFKSAHARRKAAAAVAFDGFKSDKTKVMPPLTAGQKNEASDIMAQYGPDYYRQVIREEIQDQAPQLRDEEQRVAAQKAALVNIREDYKKQLVLLDDQITQLQKDKTNEKALTDQMLAENVQRRQELVRLYSELEEGLNSRNLAQSREKDLREQLEYMQKKLARLAEENQKVTAEITRLEAGNK